MDKQKCPECKATKYTNPSLKMMVNACGHALCENCVDILFSRGSGACPQCKTPLRRGQFRFQILAEYNNYLEFVESAVFNLANEIDVEATKRSVEEFKKAHADAIKSNRLRRRPELAALDNVIESEASGSGRSNGVETAAAAAAPGT
uniref:CDK-activating kinase assembly factor MAT1 n=1 Tax=Macrostomum lignano TaxID=282301 RepID=A0A1I8HUN9_9PLAT